MLHKCNAYDSTVYACKTSVRATSPIVELAPPYFVDTAETKLRTHPTVRKPSGIPPTSGHDHERFQPAVTIPNYFFFPSTLRVQTVVTLKIVIPTGRVCVK